MNEKLAKAWELFDSGNYTDAEALYRKCLEQIPSTDHETYWQVLMGLIYVESFSKNFKEARSYVALLLSSTIDNEEKHIALHQAGMTERMAENYEKAMDYILQEEAVIREFFADDPLVLSVNLYEQGYLSLKLNKLSAAEEIMQSALTFAEKSGDFISIGCAYRGLGEIMKAANKNDEADTYFKTAIVAFEQGGDPYAVEEVQALLSL